jgi:hypothetical protein
MTNVYQLDGEKTDLKKSRAFELEWVVQMQFIGQWEKSLSVISRSLGCSFTLLGWHNYAKMADLLVLMNFLVDYHIWRLSSFPQVEFHDFGMLK